MVRVKDAGKSECLTVMARIEVAIVACGKTKQSRLLPTKVVPTSDEWKYD